MKIEYAYIDAAPWKSRFFRVLAALLRVRYAYPAGTTTEVSAGTRFHNCSYAGSASP